MNSPREDEEFAFNNSQPQMQNTMNSLDATKARIFNPRDNSIQHSVSSNDMTSVAVIWNRDNKEEHRNFLNNYFKDDSKDHQKKRVTAVTPRIFKAKNVFPEVQSTGRASPIVDN